MKDGTETDIIIKILSIDYWGGNKEKECEADSEKRKGGYRERKRENRQRSKDREIYI